MESLFFCGRMRANMIVETAPQLAPVSAVAGPFGKVGQKRTVGVMI